MPDAVVARSPQYYLQKRNDSVIAHEICTPEKCTGCGACAQVCVKSCISMEENSEGFLYPVIDYNACIDCGLCRKTCPVNHATKTRASSFYMAWHRDVEVLRRSSSGGVFTALADYVLAQGGVVFGASWNPDNRQVLHTMIENPAQLDKLRLSKYYQSDTKNVYKEAKALLAQKRMVLFSGTACQIAALYAVVGGNQESLLTVDILCHGVASKKVVDAYITSKEKYYKKKIDSFQFRAKGEDTQWANGESSRMRLIFTDGTDYIEAHSTDTFYNGFNGSMFLRESCYRCDYCGTDRIADFTLADFWGVHPDTVPAEQLKLGVSLMLCNSQKARDILPALSDTLVMTEIDPQAAIPFNLALVKPNARPQQRDTFFQQLETREYDQIIKGIFWKLYLKKSVKKALVTLIGQSQFEKCKRLLRK